MFYKQNSNKRQLPYQINNSTRLQDERKLMQLWKEQQVIEDYQMILLKYFDQFANKVELHQQIKIELKRTYQHDSFYFKIQRLLVEREKTIEKLKNQAIFLERFKNEYYLKEPNLEPVCILIDHIRKIHLLVSEEVYEMFTTYGHPRKTKVGFRYLHIFNEFNAEIQFLNDSLMKYYLPFSTGFDPLFLETVQKLRKCYANQLLVYDESVEDLINLNASYLYRLLRAHQRMLQLISVANQQKEQFYRYSQPNQQLQLNESRQEQRPRQRPQKSNSLRREPPFFYSPISIHHPDDNQSSSLQNLQRKQRQLQSRLKRMETQKKQRQAQLLSRAKKLELQNQMKSIQIQRLEQQKKSSIYSRPTNTATKTNPPTEVGKQVQSMPRPLQKSNRHSSLHGSHSKSRSNTPQHNPLSIQRQRTFQPQIYPIKIQPHHQRHRTQQSTLAKNHNKNMSHSRSKHLPKLQKSKIECNQKSKDCLCRQKYKQKHIHQQEGLSEQQLERRRRKIIYDIQAKYKAQAQKQMRFQLSKLGDITYHKIRNQENSRVSTVKGKKKIFL